MLEWVERSEAESENVTYKERLNGKHGLTWEEKYFLELAMRVGQEQWGRVLELVERGSAAGRLEYPALRRLLAEITHALGPRGRNRLRVPLMEALGDQPEWDPDQERLLEETRRNGATDEEKAQGCTFLGARSIHLFRCTLALKMGFGALAAQHLSQANFSRTEQRQVIAILCYRFGFPFGMELARNLDDV